MSKTLEKTLRKEIVAALREEWDAQAVENVVAVGVPDVECTLGWLELKTHHGWPKDEGQSFVLDHPISNEQAIWLRRRWRKKGGAYLVVQVGDEYLVFTGEAAFRLWRGGCGTREHFCSLAVGRAKGLKALTENLAKWMQQHRP